MDEINLSPLVSVVIPVYNCEKWIEKTINSVIAQSYKNLEIIIVNDGSTDNTLNITSKLFASIDNVEIINIENSGPAVARNKGVNISRGSLIAFLDADDTWHPTKIEKQVSFFMGNSSSLVLTNIKIIDESDKVIGTQEKKINSVKKQQVIDLFKGNVTMNTPTIMVKKAIFNEFGGFKSELIHREDHYFLMQVANKYGLDLLEDYLVYRRKWDNSMTSDVKKYYSNEKDLINFYYKTRYPFFDASVNNFPFLTEYKNVEIKEFHNKLSTHLYDAGFTNEARRQLIKAIKYKFSFKTLFKFILYSSPARFREIVQNEK